jgi:hypothetical protein
MVLARLLARGPRKHLSRVERTSHYWIKYMITGLLTGRNACNESI